MPALCHLRVRLEIFLSNFFRLPGVHPPEKVGAVPGALEKVLAHLSERNVVVKRAASSQSPH